MCIYIHIYIKRSRNEAKWKDYAYFLALSVTSNSLLEPCSGLCSNTLHNLELNSGVCAATGCQHPPPLVSRFSLEQLEGFVDQGPPSCQDLLSDRMQNGLVREQR